MNVLLVVAGVALVLGGLVFVIVRLRRGDIGFGQLRNESPETRRAVQRAIRDGEAEDARVDQLARRVIRAAPNVRGLKYLFGTLVVLSIARLIFDSHTTSDFALHSSQAALWAGAIVADVVAQRRRDGYRGLADKPTPDRVPPEA